jgi:hypothetical protein
MIITVRHPIPAKRRCRPMTSAPIRDPLNDHFLTPQNAAFLFMRN